MTPRQNLRYFLHARVFIAYMLFPVLRMIAAIVPMAAAISMLLEKNQDVSQHFLSYITGFNEEDLDRDAAVPYVLKCLMVFGSTFTLVSSIVNICQGIHLIRSKAVNENWSRALEDYMDGFMFAACGNLAMNITMMVSLGDQKLPHPVFLGVVAFLAIAMEMVATCFSHTLVDSVDVVYVKVSVIDTFQADESTGIAIDLQKIEYGYVGEDSPAIINTSSA